MIKIPKQQDAVNWSYYTRWMLAILLASLKLTKILNISWWLVTAPIWIMPVISITVMSLMIGTVLLLALLIAVGILKDEDGY